MLIRHCHVNRVGPQRPTWIPFQAAALALSHNIECVFSKSFECELAVFFGGDPDSPDTLGRFYADVQMYANSGVDPESYFGSWITDQIAGAANSFHGRNVQRFQSEEYDRLYAELHKTVDMEQRNQITIALNDLLVGSYSIIPLIHRGNVSAHSNDIEGVRMNAWDSELWNFETWTRRD